MSGKSRPRSRPASRTRERRRRLGFVREHGDAATVAFGAIERGVGARDETVQREAVARRERDSYADPDANLFSPDLIGRAEGANDAMRDQQRFVLVTNSALDDDEFVAAETRGRVLAADRAEKTLGDRAKERVADEMAIGVVDGLEPIEIEAVDRQTVAVAAQPSERLREVRWRVSRAPGRLCCEASVSCYFVAVGVIAVPASRRDSRFAPRFAQRSPAGIETVAISTLGGSADQ